MNSPDPTPSSTRPPARFTAINVPRDPTLQQQAKAGHCLLEPPCQQGRHGFYFSPVASMNSVSNRLGRYHMTEEGLKHDLGALKRGEIYHKDDFLVRVRAWYKAEIGRLTHLDKVHEEWKLAIEAKREEEKKLQEETGTPATNTDDETYERPSIHANQATILPGEATSKPPRTKKPREKKPPAAPTRVQPSRNAKRKDPPPAPPPPTKRTKKTTKSIPAPINPKLNPPSPTLSSPLTPPPRTSSLSPPPEYKPPTAVPPVDPSTQPPEISTTSSTPTTPPPPPPPETKSHYTLPPYDWSSYKRSLHSTTTNEPEAEANAFVARVEQAVGERVQALEILGRGSSRGFDVRGGGGGFGKGLGFLRDAELEGRTAVVRERFEPAARREDRLAWGMGVVDVGWGEEGVDFEVDFGDGDGDGSDGGEVQVGEGDREEAEIGKGEGEVGDKVEGGRLEGKVVVVVDGDEGRKESLKLEIGEGAPAEEEEEELTSALSDQFDDAMREMEEERRSSDGQSKGEESESVKIEGESLYGDETPGEQRPEDEPFNTPARTPFYFTEDEDLEDVQLPGDSADNQLKDAPETPADTPSYDADIPDPQANEDADMVIIEDDSTADSEDDVKLKTESDLELEETDVEIILDGSIADNDDDDVKPKDESDQDPDDHSREPTRIPWDYSPTDSEASDSPDDDAMQASREAFDWNPDNDDDSAMEIEEQDTYDAEAELASNDIPVSEPQPAQTAPASPLPPPEATPISPPPTAPPLILIPGLNLLHPPADLEPSPPTIRTPSPPPQLATPAHPLPSSEQNLSPSERNLLIERELFGYEGSDTDVHGFVDDDDDDDGIDLEDGENLPHRRSNGPSPTTITPPPGPATPSEAVMDVSPTLGRWIPRGAEEEVVLREGVEVSGLRFLVDCRDLERAGEEEGGYEVLILML